MGKPDELTKADLEFLELVHPGRPLNVEDAAAILGKPVAAVSRTRNRLNRNGFVASWRDYLDAIRLTKAGRAAIRKGSD